MDSQLFRGTCCKAQGRELLGATKGSGRSRQDYCTAHGRPKQLRVRELAPGARAVLGAARPPEPPRPVEDAVIPRCEAAAGELRGLAAPCRQAPDWRARKGRDYPLACLLAIMVMATLAGVVRGQRDLAASAAKLTQPRLRALGSYRNRPGRRDHPKETTFQRVLARLDAECFERMLVARDIQRAVPADGDDQVAIDGKARCGSTPHVGNERKAQPASARSQPSGRVPGTVAVETKSNEIPAARLLLEKPGPLDGRLLIFDAPHSCRETLRQVHQDNGADFLVPAKGNHPDLEARAKGCLPDRAPAVIPPRGARPAIVVPPPPCVTAASKDGNNRSRREWRSLRRVAAAAGALCRTGVRPVIEITRETLVLRGKNKGQRSSGRIVYISSLEPDPARGDELPARIRRYRDIEGGLHQRPDVSAGEDSSRVRNRNAILVLGILRRCAVGVFYDWRRKRSNLRQPTFKDFHDAMNRFNHRLAFAMITSRHPSL